MIYNYNILYNKSDNIKLENFTNILINLKNNFSNDNINELSKFLSLNNKQLLSQNLSIKENIYNLYNFIDKNDNNYLLSFEYTECIKYVFGYEIIKQYKKIYNLCYWKKYFPKLLTKMDVPQKVLDKILRKLKNSNITINDIMWDIYCSSIDNIYKLIIEDYIDFNALFNARKARVKKEHKKNSISPLGSVKCSVKCSIK